MHKCTKINLRGDDKNFNITDQKTNHTKTVENLGIHASDNLTWKTHIEERLRKAKKVLYFLRKNVAVKVQTLSKLGLYKSLILPVLLYGFSYIFTSRIDLHQLENFQRNVVRWINGKKTKNYLSQLRILNILPLAMFLQLNDILLLSKITHEEMATSIGLPKRPEIRRRQREIFKLWRTQTEKARSDFVFRSCRFVNRLDDTLDFKNPQEQKNRFLKLLWKFVDDIYSESKVCTLQLLCDCLTCRNNWTSF